MSKQKASHQNENSSAVASYYDILGVSPEASADEIKTRYKALVLKFHPDKESSALASDAMVLINNAYEVLSDPQRRAAYDVILTVQSHETGSNKEKKKGWLAAYLGKAFTMKRIPAVIAMSLVISCLAGYAADSSHAEGKSILDQFMRTNGHYTAAILHEPIASLPLYIPFFGMVWGVLAGFTAGFLDRGVMMATSALPAKASGYFLFYAFFALALKLAAYQWGMCQSLELAICIKQRHFNYLDRMFITGGIIMSLIFATLAGYVEHAMANIG